MNKAPLLSTAIRTNCAERLLRTISIPRMHNSLSELFVDSIKNETSLFESKKEHFMMVMKYNNCLHLNDERTFEFNQRFKQSYDVYDDNLFIPRDDAQ